MKTGHTSICSTLLILATVLFGPSPALRAGTAPANGGNTVLGVESSCFTLNGAPAFLLGFSYYGALGASEDFVRKDLDDFQSRGFNWLRVWATWGLFENDVSALHASGEPREPFLSRLKWLVAECDRRGMAVDVTLTRGKGTPAAVAGGRLPSFAAHQRAVERLVTTLQPHRNWYLDLANERDVRDERFVPAEELKILRDQVRKLDPQRLVTASFGGHDLSGDDVRESLLTVGVDFLSPHRPRNAQSPSQTEARTRSCLAMMKDLGRVVPVHHQEPFRRGYAQWEPVASDFLTDLRGAIAGGAAGWCFHNGHQRNGPDSEPRRSFDLHARRLFDQLDREESKVVAEAKNVLSGTRASPAYPLKVGPTKRYLVDQTGRPIFINGDTPWSLASQVSREDVALYLKQRAALGVNSLIITIPEGYYCDGCRDEDGPQDFYGAKPFLTKNKFTTPNPKYFEHADWVIRRAGDFGMQVLMCPIYTGFDSGEKSDGWYVAMARENSVADCRWYGEWIGARYKGFSNLVYVIGNDRDPGDLREKMNAVAEGIRSKDPGHLMTYHAKPGHSSADVWPPEQYSWLTLNGTYLYGDVWKKSLEDFSRKPAMPFFLFESRYENEQFKSSDVAGTPSQVRKQAYQSVLGGSCGHHYGNSPVWHMNAAPWFPNGKAPWKERLDDPGATSLLPNIKKLFESRAWHTLVPDSDRTLVTRVHDAGGDAVPAARAADGATAIIYLSSSRAVVIESSRISGKEVRAWWFNPRDGSHSEIGRYPTKGELEFKSPSADDWVLVLDDAAKNFPPPGATSAAP